MGRMSSPCERETPAGVAGDVWLRAGVRGASGARGVVGSSSWIVARMCTVARERAAAADAVVGEEEVFLM